MKGTCLSALCCDPAVAAGDALCCQPCILQAMHAPSATLTRCCCCCPAILTTRSPSHPAKSSPLPSHCYFFGCFLPFCSPPCNPKLLLRSPARQDPRKLTAAPVPRKDGEPRGEDIRAMPRLPGRLPAGIPRLWMNKVLRKELGIRIPQSHTGTSQYHSQVIFLAKTRGRGNQYPSLSPSSHRETEKGKKKKRRRFRDVFGNRLKQTGKSPLI